MRKNNKFKLNYIAPTLAKVLKIIHSIPINYKFGWITDNEVLENESFSLYLENELKRFSDSVKGKIAIADYNYMMRVAKEKLDLIKKYDSKLTPQLIWFDLNPNNILVKNNGDSFELSSIIDAGGAKIGIKEWDLAFIKMETCINQDEYNSIFNEYKKLDSNLNEDLIDALSVFIELDDMIIRVLDGVKLPIPYDSFFEKIINNLR